MSLSAEQEAAVNQDGHVVIRACPGSGKTRVLLYRVMRGLKEVASPKHRVVALTFTNRAADEIQARLDLAGIPTEQLWTGTIHSFALEWIARPYAPYSDVLRKGFSVADEYYAQRLIEELCTADPLPGRFDRVETHRLRNGANPNSGVVAARIYDRYKQRLESEKLLDYDDILFHSYQLLLNRPEIAETLASIMPLVCVDEIQDIQDLHYAVLSQIVRQHGANSTFFFVGDSLIQTLEIGSAHTRETLIPFFTTAVCRFLAASGHLELGTNMIRHLGRIKIHEMPDPVVRDSP